eukprot:9091271-Alexandrium_andersonii.AAC.1
MFNQRWRRSGCQNVRLRSLRCVPVAIAFCCVRLLMLPDGVVVGLQPVTQLHPWLPPRPPRLHLGLRPGCVLVASPLRTRDCVPNC